MDLHASAQGSRRDRPIFLLHIPKTGGNTIISQFLGFMPVEAVWPPPPGLVLDDAALAEAARRLPSLRFLHGHVEDGLTRHLPLDALRLVTFVRHPVRLAVSHYLYLRQQPDNQLHAAAAAMSIEQFLRRFPNVATEPQSRYIARALGFPTRPGLALGPAGVGFVLDALERFAFVGVTERMAESIAAMADELGLPLFPVGRENAVRASRDEAEALAARVTRDEFLMQLGADFALRRAAEAWLTRWHRDRRRRFVAARLDQALAGHATMPEVVAEAPGMAVAFLDGWFPQGWSGAPGSACRYWWTRSTATLLVVARAATPCRLRLRVVNTMRFDAAAITAEIDDTALPAAAAFACDGEGIDLTLAIPPAALASGSALITLRAPHALPFSELDPGIDDHEPRGFAVRDFVLETAG